MVTGGGVPRWMLFTDEPILAEGWHQVLSAEADLEVMHASCRPAELPGYIAARKPDLLLLDFASGLGVNSISELCAAAPESAVTVWARAIPAEMAYQLIELGVRGVLLKTASLESLVQDLRAIAAGSIRCDDTLAASLPALEKVPLTSRESEILTLLARGMKNREMADVLSLTEGTVKVHLCRMFRKTRVKDRFQLALYGVRNLGATSP